MIPSKHRPLLRSSHHKSRFGCRECKERHTKCDETHPSCNNCTNSKRQCSFTRLPRSSLVDIQPRKRVIRSDRNTKMSSVKLTTADSNRHKISPSPRRRHALLDEHYSITHLELLHDFEHRLGPDAYHFLPKWGDLLKMSMKEAFRSEYLMDALIAVAAAHRSTLPGENHNFYRNEATRLLTRSVTKFNAEEEITEDYAMTAFLFTIFLGQLVIFDIFAEGGSLISILDRFVHCMKLHQGVREVVAPVWHKVEPVLTCQLAEWGSDGIPKQMERNRECSPLWEMLSRSDVSDSSRQVYSSSIEALQSMLDSSCVSPTQRMPVVQQWLIRVPVGFIDLIGQRRPEALVILAYYAVLLHQAREFWAVGNAGRLLIQLISAYLGEYWSHWLKWPNEMLEMSPV